MKTLESFAPRPASQVHNLFHATAAAAATSLFWACAYFDLLLYPYILLFGIACLIFFFLRNKSRSVTLTFFGLNILSLFFYPNRLLGLCLIEWALIFLLILFPLLYFSKYRNRFFRPYPFFWQLSFASLALVLSVIHAISSDLFVRSSLIFNFRFLISLSWFFLFTALLSNTNFKKNLHYFLNGGILFVILMMVFLVIKQHYFLDKRLSVAGLLHPNWISVLVEMFFPIAFFFGVGTKKRKLRFFYFLTSSVFFVVIMMTYSKGGLLAVALCSAFIFFKYFSWKTLVVSIGIASASVYFYGEGFLERLSIRDSSELVSSLTRIELWKTAAKIITSHTMILGLGMNSFATIKQSFGFFAGLDPENVFSPHNLYLELFVAMGGAGVLLFLFPIASTCYQLLRLEMGENNYLRYGLVLSIISYLLHGLVECVIIVPTITICFFTILAFAKFLVDNFRGIRPEGF